MSAVGDGVHTCRSVPSNWNSERNLTVLHHQWCTTRRLWQVLHHRLWYATTWTRYGATPPVAITVGATPQVVVHYHPDTVLQYKRSGVAVQMYTNTDWLLWWQWEHINAHRMGLGTYYSARLE